MCVGITQLAVFHYDLAHERADFFFIVDHDHARERLIRLKHDLMEVALRAVLVRPTEQDRFVRVGDDGSVSDLGRRRRALCAARALIVCCVSRCGHDAIGRAAAPSRARVTIGLTNWVLGTYGPRMTMLYHTPLDAEAQLAFGLNRPHPLAMADQVRFSELDVLNHVNNAVYMQWFERVRVRYTQLWGISRYLGHGDGPRIVIRSGTIHYKQEMLMDEDYVVTCGCKAFRNTSFSMAQELWAGGTLRATFDCVLVLLKQDGSGRYPIPDDVKQLFIAIDGASDEG